MQRQKQRLFEFKGGVFSSIEKIFDGIALGFLWLLFSLPIITIGASTTAFYYTTTKVIKNERGYILEEFLKAFKANFASATILWVFVMGISFVLQLNVGILSSLTNGLVGLFFICCYMFLVIFVIGVVAYIFPALSRFDMSAGWILKLAIYMTVRYFPTTIVLITILVGTVVLIFFAPYLILILPIGVVLLFSYFMERVLSKHTPKIE